MTSSFKFFRHFNAPELADLAGKRVRLDPRFAVHFQGEGLPERLVRALAERRALPFKEVMESFEFFQRTRKRARAKVVVDLCCGHGLTGALFAVFEPVVEQVILVDKVRPPSYDSVLDAVREVAPWAVEKIEYRETTLNKVVGHLPEGANIVAVHACGARTDRSIDAALATGGTVAVLPCCYSQVGKEAPDALRQALGKELATDVARTYRLEAAGYEVLWSELPEAVTEKNRVIIASPPKQR